MLSKPFMLEFDFFIEIANELTVLLIGLRMIQLAFSDMDYPKTLEHGMFTIGIVCFLILINLMRFVYGIYLLIKRAAQKKDFAKVKNLEV